MPDTMPCAADSKRQARAALTAAEIRRRIQVRFGRTSAVVPEHLVLFEVGAREAAWKMRRIDAVAVGLLKRTDYLIHGFEIKTTRSDLRSELNDPNKAGSAQRYCDRWWLALASIDLLHDSDPLPEHWGIIACAGRGLRVYRHPAPVARIDSPEFRAALLHACQRSPSYRRAMGYQAGFQKGLDAMRGHSEAAYSRGFQHGRWQERTERENGQAV